MSSGDVPENLKNTSSNFVARYNGPDVEDMTPKQKEIRDSILATRKGTGLSGPFGPWLAIPEIAGPAQVRKSQETLSKFLV